MDESVVKTAKKKRLDRAEKNSEENDGDDKDDEKRDMEVWDTLSESFGRVQSLLDQNRALIQQVNDNRQSKIPDNLTKNVSLIREINTNITKVLAVYSDLSLDFSNIVRSRGAITSSKTSNDGDEGDRSDDKAERAKNN